MTAHYTVPQSWHDEYFKAKEESMKDPWIAYLNSDECTRMCREFEILDLEEAGEIVAGLA